jgi:hypothetical protein
MKKNILLGLYVLSTLISCASDYYPGSIFSIDGESGFTVVKVVTFEKGGVFYFKVFNEKFSERPEKVDLKELTPKMAENGKDFYIMPVPKELFFQWRPKYLGREEVSDKEQESVRLVKKVF